MMPNVYWMKYVPVEYLASQRVEIAWTHCVESGPRASKEHNAPSSYSASIESLVRAVEISNMSSLRNRDQLVVHQLILASPNSEPPGE